MEHIIGKVVDYALYIHYKYWRWWDLLLFGLVMLIGYAIAEDIWARLKKRRKHRRKKKNVKPDEALRNFRTC